MSGPKAKCPSCGTEWEGPVIFCGECGAPVAPPGERAARLPGASGGGVRRANTLVGSLPGVPVSPANAPPVPDRRTVVGMPAAGTTAEGRTPAVTMVSPVAALDPKPAKGKKQRRSTAEEKIIVDEGWGTLPPPKPPEKLQVEAPKPTEVPKPAPAKPEPEVVKLEAAPVAAPKPAADDGPRIEVHAEEAPSAPAPDRGTRASAPPGDFEDTQRLLDDLDAGFENIVRPSAPVVWLGSGSSPPPAPAAVELPQAEPSQPTPSTVARAARHEADMAEVRELFAGIAVAYARPLRDFMIEVAWGEPTKEWLDVALPAAQALRRAASAVELPEVDTALEGYIAALELATGEGSIHREVREMLAGAYARLIEALPSVFALEGELGRREPIIVRSLLLQVPGVRHVAIDKLYRAGINALDVFYAARPRELSEATGLEEPLAAAICDRFQRYKREVAALSPGQDRAKERAELQTLTEELARAHEAHEKAASSWGPGAAAEKSRARQVRADTVVRIDLLLAHLGEVDLQRALAKVPFQQKIKDLRRFLEAAEQRAAR